MSDLISRHGVIKAVDKFIPADPMKSDYTQGISVGLALATRCIEEFSQETDDSSQGLVKDLISRQDVIDALYAEFEYVYCYNCDHEGNEEWCEDCHRKYMKWSASRNTIERVLNDLPSAQPERKNGKWLRSGSSIFPYECDQCGDTNERATPFCPNCGSYNGGEQDEKCRQV